MKLTRQDWINARNHYHETRNFGRVWNDAPLAEREALAFSINGCAVSMPTWGDEPIDCCHLKCKILRGEAQPDDETRSILESERGNWLRGMTDDAFDKLLTACLKVAHETGIYDPWKMPGGWQAIVWTGLGQ